MTSKPRKKNLDIKPFTLIEVMTCVAILGLIASLIGWQMNTMISDYRFQASIDLFISDLQKAQLICLSDRVEMELVIEKEKKKYKYFLRSDDPIPCFLSKPRWLKGVYEIKLQNRAIENGILPIANSGKIGNDKITFKQKKEKRAIIDLTCL